MIKNLTADAKEKILRGDMNHLKEVLVSELEEQKTLLVNSDVKDLKLIQGHCRSLDSIIKLLP